MRTIFLIFLSLIIIFVIGCVPVDTQQEPEEPTVVVKVPDKEPSVVGPVPEEETVGEPEKEAVEAKETTDEVKELLSRSEQKVESVFYRYKGPETADFFYDFYVKDDRIRYIMEPTLRTIDVDAAAYESVFLKKDTRFAGGYCYAKKCTVSGKKATLKYSDAYIMTPFDWLEQMGNAEKLGEELLGKRQTSRLQTENAGIVWVDNFFGVPQQVEFEGNLYQYTQMDFNNVKNSDVVPD
jgi:hypothetical protein|tara:strand:- start:38 stop:751 length:714 start_codon:yes stop_codon:yes gene_type:complete